MNPPRPAVFYSTGLIFAFGAGWFLKLASLPANLEALSPTALLAKRPSRPIPQKPANAATASGGNWLDAASADVAEIRAARQPGVVNQVLLDKLKAILNLTDPFPRLASWQGLMSEMHPEDAIGVLEIFGGLDREGRWATEELSSFLHQWGGIDGPNALLSLGKLPTRSIIDDRFIQVMTGWGQKDANGAMAWLKAQDVQKINLEAAVAGIFAGLAATDLKAAEAMLLANTEGFEFMPLFNRVTSYRVKRDGTSATVAWFTRIAGEALPDNYKKENLAALTQLIQRKESIHGDITTGLTTLLPAYANEPWLPGNAGQVLGQYWSEIDPQSGLAKIQQMTAQEAQEAATEQLTRQWAERNPQTLSLWLTENGNHPSFDQAAYQLTRSLETTDPEAARAWAAQIKDPDLKAEAVKPPPLDPLATGE